MIQKTRNARHIAGRSVSFARPRKEGLLAAVMLQVAEIVAVNVIGGEELVDGEFDAAEQLAGVVVRRSDALFVGQAEVDDRHNKLGVALQADNGELAERAEYPLFFAAGDDLIFKAAADMLRYVDEVIAAMATALTGLNQLHIQADRINDFHHGCGQIGFPHQLLIQAVQIGLGGENLRVALAAKEDHALIECSQSGDLDRRAHTAKRVDGHFVEVLDIHRIEPTVERYALYRVVYMTVNL